MSARILLVDDEPSIRRAVGTLLRSRGYAVSAAVTGAEALDLFDRERPELVIVDLGLPDLDGIVVCQRLRARGDVPIVVLSVKGEERSKVEALDAGADDYVTKPFGAEELLARIRVGLRRSHERGRDLHGHIRHGELLIDFDTHRVFRGNSEIRLTPREFELLTLLAAHAGRILTHRTILKAIWGANAAAQHEHLRVLVRQLRKKLEVDPAHPQFVVTEPWVGYRLARGG